MHRIAALLLALCPLAALAQSPAPPQTVPILMLSDIHFDPFHDPGKVAQLMHAPVSRWQAILSSPASSLQADSFADLESACKVKGTDTPWPLLASTLSAAHDRLPHPLFITLSGDLMAHKFDCLYQKFYPASSRDTFAADYSAFAAKTVAFVALQLRRSFPGTPIYIALGNNDSGCKDYSETPGSAFLRADAAAFAADTLSPANRAAYLREFPALGDVNLELPPPFHHTRLLVLQDIFASKRFAPCGSDSTTANVAQPAAQQITWLRQQLDHARAAHQKVWLLAHIPPGVDAYSTLSKGARVCSGADPEMFLASTALASVLTDYADSLRLVLMGHTHMDEMKLLTASSGAAVPLKLVPSVSPVNGNNPAFTIAQVDPRRALLIDYQVYSATSQGASGWDRAPVWSEEYRYSTTYAQPDYSAASLHSLTQALLADKAGATADSQAYQRFYFVGDPHLSANAKASALKLVWPAYACSMTAANPAEYRACVCPAQP